MQERRNSIANALELHPSCTNPSIWRYLYIGTLYFVSYICISMAKCKTAVTPLLTHWSYCSLVLSHRYHEITNGFLQPLSKTTDWRPMAARTAYPSCWWTSTTSPTWRKECPVAIVGSTLESTQEIQPRLHNKWRTIHLDFCYNTCYHTGGRSLFCMFSDMKTVVMLFDSNFTEMRSYGFNNSIEPIIARTEQATSYCMTQSPVDILNFNWNANHSLIDTKPITFIPIRTVVGMFRVGEVKYTGKIGH